MNPYRGARRTRIRIGDSILYGLLDPVVIVDDEYHTYSGEYNWAGHYEFFLDGNGSIINLPASSWDGQIGWTET